MNSPLTEGAQQSAVDAGALRTLTEQTIAAIWVEVLELPHTPGATEDFFDLGGNSMAMVMAEFRILEEVAVQLPSGALLTASTVREIAELIDQLSTDLHECKSATPLAG